jgi:hypothetical protein
MNVVIAKSVCVLLPSQFRQVPYERGSVVDDTFVILFVDDWQVSAWISFRAKFVHLVPLTVHPCSGGSDSNGAQQVSWQNCLVKKLALVVDSAALVGSGKTKRTLLFS